MLDHPTLLNSLEIIVKSACCRDHTSQSAFGSLSPASIAKHAIRCHALLILANTLLCDRRLFA